MIIIKDIELLEVEDARPYQFVHPPVGGEDIIDLSQALPNNQLCTVETVKPLVFITRDVRMYVGATEKAQEVMGIWYGAWEQNNRLRKKIEGLSFWQRLKFLFIGKI